MLLETDILYEDNHIIIINKAANIPVQGDITGDLCLLDIVKEYIKIKYNKPGAVFLGLVHRIDRPISGIVLLAKTSKALTRLNEMFKTRNINKTYWAIVKNEVPAVKMLLCNYLKKNSTQNKSYIVKENTAGAAKAVLEYSLISKSDKYYLLEIILHTGRHHQIRAQLANIGCPIKGDIKYGFDRPNKDGSICLHSRKIEFIHPVTNKNISIIAAPPSNEALWKCFNI